ncbi:MAG: hypothetical protein CMB99_10870 [Flavobacteriaceae bacterium]|nr:hypothetical protein [Flavobacteriaceae bacterium]|tara:strand:- start:153910 stop:154878 length:969 start_codon:yes stop_codon:yes gene_type:complete
MKCRDTKNEIFKKVILPSKLLFVAFFVFSNILVAQDSIPIAKDLTEEKELEFQQFFFKALSEKSIGNYQNAIQNLENCNQILQNDVSVYFEFSKNYLLLKEYLQAQEYIQRAIEKQPKNIWLLKHQVRILDNQRNYSEAIRIQEKVVALDRKEKEGLATLYVKSRNYKKALEIIDEIEKNRPLSSRLRYFKKFYGGRGVKKQKDVPSNSLDALKRRFENNKSFEALNALLKAIKSGEERLTYLNKGLELFPAQAGLYYQKGQYLFGKEQYQETISVLENGIDFVIEDSMLKEFYQLLMKSHQKMGDKNKEQQYKLKLDKLNR